jgi:serine/threonine-protein kinase HipA
MTLHLVGETIDKTRSHYQAETGKLVQLMRGVYVDADNDIDATVLKHAVRIARYLYPRAYLSAASAVLLGPTRDGRLFLSGRRNKRTRIRALEIIQNEVPKHPSLIAAVVDDGMGEFRIDVSSVRQRFLEAFRIRSEHGGDHARLSQAPAGPLGAQAQRQGRPSAPRGLPGSCQHGRTGFLLSAISLTDSADARWF